MRKTALIALTVCVATLALAAIAPLHAQEAAPAPPPAAVAPAATPPPAPAPDQPLAIPAPPGMTIQVEMDLHDDDLLGVFKSLLKGVGQAADSAKSAAEDKPASAKTPQDADIAAILSNADLSDVLKDVTHIRFILYGPPTPPAGAAARPAIKPHLPTAGETASGDLTPFYENAFATEGGHRVIFVNSAPVHILMTSFGKGHGFAFLVQSPDSVGVLRADGYPDLSKLAALATSIGAAAGKSVMGDMGDRDKPDAPKP